MSNKRLFSFLCDINVKCLCVLAFKELPQSDLDSLNDHPFWIFPPPFRRYQMLTIIPYQVLLGSVAPAQWAHPLPAHAEAGGLCASSSLWFSGAMVTWMLEPGRQRSRALSQLQLLRSERQPLGAHYTFLLGTPAFTLYLTRMLNSCWLRDKACFLPGCPGLSFFPLSLFGVQG